MVDREGAKMTDVDHIDSGTLELLKWIAARPALGYAEAIEAWRSTCPRMTPWEDAQIAGLVQVRSGAVALTDRGQAALSVSHRKPAMAEMITPPDSMSSLCEDVHGACHDQADHHQGDQ